MDSERQTGQAIPPVMETSNMHNYSEVRERLDISIDHELTMRVKKVCLKFPMRMNWGMRPLLLCQLIKTGLP